MKKKMKKITALVIVLTMLVTTLVVAPLSAHAAIGTTQALESYGLDIWADAENVLSQDSIAAFSTDKNATLGGIKPYAIEGGSTGGLGGIIGGSWGGSSSSASKYYWFFPSTADLSAMKFWFDTSKALTIDGVTITSGQPSNVFQDINEGGVSKSVSISFAGKTYTVVAIKSGDVGTVYVDTNSGSIKTINSSDHTTSEAGTVMVVQPDGTVDYKGYMPKMSGRGNGTWSTSNTKNPYNIKLETSTSLLGMNAAKKWVLLANKEDPTLLNNQLTYDFADYIGVKYQPHCKPVDLYVNQQYYGSYQLAEKVELKSNRINIDDAYENLELANGTVDPTTGAIIPADLNGTSVTSSNSGNGDTIGGKRYSTTLKNPSDITGGYLIELEISQRWVKENAGFCGYNKQGWVLKSCDYATKEMVDYMYDKFFALGASVYNGGVVPSTAKTESYSKGTSSNPAPAEQYRGLKWSDILDADSAVRYYWTQEFFKNMDSTTSSTYFYKDVDSKDPMIHSGPVWDMDQSITWQKSASRWGYSYSSTDGWYTKNVGIYRYKYSDSGNTYPAGPGNQVPYAFYGALATNCADFWQMAGKYWNNLISPAVNILTGVSTDPTGKLKSTAEYVNAIQKTGTMNNYRFGTSSAYDVSSVTNGMNNWFTERQTWINGQLPKTTIQNASVADIPDQVYTGSAIEPKVEAQILGYVDLVEGEDYTLSYTNNVDAGRATAVLTGIGAYTGSCKKSFNIVAGDLSTDYTLEIPQSSYKNTTLRAALKSNTSGGIVTASASYQWYRDGVAINGATDAEYITTAADSGTVITCVATGDGVNLVNSITSNSCNVATGERPEGFTRTIASWDYDYTNAADALITADEAGETYYYVATGGENQATSNLYASVNATDHAKIKWSGAADLYANGDITDQSPVMGTSKTDLLAWGEYPYFETEVSTAGYENIHLSAKLGGTKKGPKDWKLQYSLDGSTYTDIDGATYSIVNNKTLELAFDNVALPEACDNQLKVYIRMVASNDLAINGINTIVNQVSGDAAINNIAVTGQSLSVITELFAPTVTPSDDSAPASLFDDTMITITDNNGGADNYYTINGGEPVLYTAPFNPFNTKTAKVGDTVTVTAYASFDTIESDAVTSTYTFAGVDISSFCYDDYSTDVTLGAVPSTAGVYGESGRMTAYTDGISQYVPLWRADNGSFCVSPDDGALWTENSGFTYKISTAGYENVNFSCMAYTTGQGPKSLTLQYSTDGNTYYNVVTNKTLAANGTLEQLFLTTQLPAACDNQRTLFIRLATTENLTSLGDAQLHNNASKGNLYVNNVVVAGEDDGSFKMPYTNKSTNYFGASGVIEYISPDGIGMQYIVKDSNDSIVQSGTYPEGGIQLSTVDGFDSTTQEPYTVLIQAVDDEDSSLTNAATYTYKGETVVKFNYNDTKKLFTDYVAADSLSVANTAGVNAGTLSMYPNATTPATLSYTGTYGVKVGWTAENPFVASKKLDNPKNNGYWLIQTSTTGYEGLSLNLEQLSSNKGPRDWGIAYSTNGSTYTYVANSNARAISNDASTNPVETYSNLPLPSACNNQANLYIKVFINGGESVDGAELETLLKGNTGINGIEINGVPLSITATIKTTVLQTPTATTGTIPYGNVDIYVNGKLRTTTNESGVATVKLPANQTAQIELNGNSVTPRAFEINATTYDVTKSVPVLVFDANGDGYINAKDYAIINKDSKADSYKGYFKNFINVKTDEFSYK